jgi:hypothetical protein
MALQVSFPGPSSGRAHAQLWALAEKVELVSMVSRKAVLASNAIDLRMRRIVVALGGFERPCRRLAANSLSLPTFLSNLIYQARYES